MGLSTNCRDESDESYQLVLLGCTNQRIAKEQMTQIIDLDIGVTMVYLMYNLRTVIRLINVPRHNCFSY